MSEFYCGQILSMPYRDEQTMRVIVIDPNGQGEGRPTLGMGFGMTEENLGLPKSTLSRWTTDQGVAHTHCNTPEGISEEGSSLLQSSILNNATKLLKAPSGNTYRVLQIPDEQGNSQMVIEGCDWVDLACDVLNSPGKVKESTLGKLNTFVRWLAKKGFYATVYAQVLGAYTKSDDNRMNQKILQLEQENTGIKEKLYELECEYALLDRESNRNRYLVDELQRDMAWHRSNSWSIS